MRSIVYNSSLKTELGTIFITANEKELLGIHFVTLAPSENENKIEMIATDGEVYISTFKGYSLNTVNQEEKICTM